MFRYKTRKNAALTTVAVATTVNTANTVDTDNTVDTAAAITTTTVDTASIDTSDATDTAAEVNTTTMVDTVDTADAVVYTVLQMTQLLPSSHSIDTTHRESEGLKNEMLKFLPEVDRAYMETLCKDKQQLPVVQQVYLLTPMDRAMLLHAKSTILPSPPEYNYQATSVGW